MEAMKNATRTLLEVSGQLGKVAEQEPLLAKKLAAVVGTHIQPGIEALIEVARKAMEPPRTPSRIGSPLDRSPAGVGADGGSPVVDPMKLIGPRPAPGAGGPPQ